jgi:DNA-binding NtrC family response regulator
MPANILIVDDDPMQRILLKNFIVKIGHNPILMSDGQQVLDLFADKKQADKVNCYNIDMIFLDVSMPRIDGFKTLKQIKQIRSDMPIVMLTALKDTELAIKAINAGAFDYIVKGEVDVFARLFATINNAIEQKNLKKEISIGNRNNKGNITFSDLIVVNSKMKSIVSLLLKTTDLDIPILLQGENGVGKELFARAIHGSSKRANMPFVIVNCGAIEKNLFETVLFGHEKGFLGNTSQVKGKIKEAEGGTLFLDNVEELHPEMQLKLLNVLKRGEYEPLGTNESLKINVRVISTTNKLLEDEVKKCHFRADLFYRLNIFSVNIPPLKERKDEIIPLANSFCSSLSIMEDKRIEKITDKAIDLLMEYNWPGNIRQLRNVIFRAVVLTDNMVIDIQHFPQIAQNSEKYKADENILSTDKSEFVKLVGTNGIRNFQDIETEIIEKIIKLCDGNISDASKKLGIGRSTLYRKLKIEETENN